MLESEIDRLFVSALQEINPESVTNFLELQDLIDYYSITPLSWAVLREAGFYCLGDLIERSDEPLSIEEVEPYLYNDLAFPYLALVSVAEDLDPDIQLRLLNTRRYGRILADSRLLSSQTIVKAIENNLEDHDFFKGKESLVEKVLSEYSDEDCCKEAEKIILQSSNLTLLELLINYSYNGDSVGAAILKAERITNWSESYYHAAFFNRNLPEPLFSELWERLIVDYKGRPSTYSLSLSNAAELIRLRRDLSSDFVKDVLCDVINVLKEEYRRASEGLSVISSPSLVLDDEVVDVLVGLLEGSFKSGVPLLKDKDVTAALSLELVRTRHSLPARLQYALVRSELMRPYISTFIAREKISNEYSIMALRDPRPISNLEKASFTLVRRSGCEDETVFLLTSLTGPGPLLDKYSNKDEIKGLLELAYDGEISFSDVENLPFDYLKQLFLSKVKTFTLDMRKDLEAFNSGDDEGLDVNKAKYFSLLKNMYRHELNYKELLLTLPTVYAREIAADPYLSEDLYETALYHPDKQVSLWFVKTSENITWTMMEKYISSYLENPARFSIKVCSEMVTRILKAESQIKEKFKSSIYELISMKEEDILLALVENTSDREIILRVMQTIMEPGFNCSTIMSEISSNIFSYDESVVKYIQENLQYLTLEEDLKSLVLTHLFLVNMTESRAELILEEIAKNFDDEHSTVWGVEVSFSLWGQVFFTDELNYEKNYESIKAILSKTKYPHFFARVIASSLDENTPEHLIRLLMDVPPDREVHPAETEIFSSIGINLYSTVLDCLTQNSTMSKKVYAEYVSAEHLQRAQMPAILKFLEHVDDPQSEFSYEVVKEMFRRGKVEKTLWVRRFDSTEKLYYVLKHLYRELYGAKVDLFNISQIMTLVRELPPPIEISS